MPLTLNVEPYLYSAINNQTYITKLKENTKKIR